MRRSAAASAVRACAMLCVAGLSLGLSGCDLGLRPGATSILEALRTDPTPSEAAAMALDPYDANRRYVGTLSLANRPFAREPIYIKLFTDNAGDDDPLVRAAAIRGLAIHGRPEHAPILVKALRDADASVRLEAARGLQRIHAPESVEQLLASMREPDPRLGARGRATSESDPQVRAEAAHALGQYPEPRVLQALIAGLDDVDLSVNRSALQALRTLTGQDLGLDRPAWVAWQQSTKTPFAARGIYLYPVFNRTKRIYEYIPFIPPPPNELEGTPTGLPRS